MSFNEYLSMGWLKPLLDFLTLIVCGLVLLGSVCRVTMLDCEIHKFSWTVLYILLAVFSAGLTVDVMTFAGLSPSWYGVIGVLAGLLHLCSTFRLWRHEPPPYTRKDFKL